MINIQNIKFAYSREVVLDGFSLQFDKGGIYGLLGKNGTGKSTLLYLMMGLLRLFLVPEEYDLPAISLSAYVKAIKPFYPRYSEDLLKQCLANFEMSTDINLGQLSMGQKKKVYMSIALASNTRYLLMDEPTNGLDILSKSQFRKVVIEGMSEDKTIIISTHQVHDVELLLDHVCIIERNKVLLNEPLVEKDEPINLEELFIKTVEQRS